jgi:serine/threonine protein kinase/dipeptidyl aminopeptidase/acylaminoacyl peptidase
MEGRVHPLFREFISKKNREELSGARVGLVHRFISSGLHQIMIGTKLAHYEITSHLGSGGMGDVYQATDSKLGRSVAIKLLPEAFTHDAERAARFEREARVLASLNHSNIAAIHGLEESGERKFLVMELVEGETLAERIKRGPIPVDESLGIAKQICEALEAAHEKGIIHRDLKPANIKITPNGKVKVLDFGLAKIFLEETANRSVSNSPTMLSARSAPGVILGTAAYMSPEQAQGKTLDKRTDIWALGAVLFEMLIGRPAFEGETVTDLLGAVVHKEPDWSKLPSQTPASIRRLLSRCLAKAARQRLHDIADARIEIEAAQQQPEAKIVETVTRRTSMVFVILALAVVTGSLVFAVLRARNINEPPAWSTVATRFQIYPPANTTFAPDWNIPFAVSPDGRRLVFVAIASDGKRQLWLRPLDSEIAQPIPGTENADGPFWSPDNQWIGFFAEEKLKKIPVSGGTAQVLDTVVNAAAIPAGYATWGAGDTIVYAAGATSGLSRVSALAGGQSSAITTIDSTSGETAHHWPILLKDGNHFIYMTAKGAGHDMVLSSLTNLTPRPLMNWGLSARGGTLAYAPGYILFVADSALVARPFDDEQLKFTGAASRIADGIPMTGPGRTPFSVSSNGVLAYWAAVAGVTSELRWFRRDGTPVETAAPAAKYTGFSASPDGRRLAFARWDNKGKRDIFLQDLASGTVSKVTFDGDSMDPIWSDDGSQLAFGSARDTPPNAYTRAVNGGEVVRQTTSRLQNRPTTWNAGRNVLVYDVVDPKTKSDIWYLDPKDKAKPVPFLQTSASELDGKLSPNGKWIAFLSDESGVLELYLASFPSRENKRPISAGGVNSQGRSAIHWRGDGKELFYVSGGQLMAAPVRNTESSIEVGKSQKLFAIASPEYSVTADGSRFLVPITVADKDAPPITLILNWHPERGK